MSEPDLDSGIADYTRFCDEHLFPALPAPPKDWEDLKPRPQLLSYAVIVCATLIAYLPALQGSLLWDDGGHVTRPDLQSLHGLWRIWFQFGATQQYYPLLHTAFWIEHKIWGDAVLGYHLVNVLLHALSACLVLRIVKRLALPGAWLAAMVFALHPVCVEAVAWISEQKSTLSAVFYLGAALTYLHYDRTRRRSHYLLATALFLLALLTKTVTATLPGALLVVLWWRRGRIEPRRDVLPLLPWFSLGVAAGLLTSWVEKSFIGAEGADFALTLAQRFELAGRAIWFYALKLLWPADLIFTYPRWNLDGQYLYPLSILAVAVGLSFLARRHRGPLAGFLIFAGTLAPVLGFLNVYPFRFSYVADHFQYLACLGIIVPGTAALMRRNWRGTTAVAVVLLMAMGALTWSQTTIYRDPETLYRATLSRNPSSWMAHNNLGFLLSQKPGGLPDAIAGYEAALRIKPDYAGAHLNLGNALVHIPGRVPDAIAEYEAALRIKPDYPEAHNALGSAIVDMPGRLQDAIAECRAAIRLKPDFAEAHNNLGYALSKMGSLPEAVAEYQAALKIRPDDAAAHYNLGTALSKIPGRRVDAIAEYEAALRTRPDLQIARQKIEQLKAAPRE